MARVLGLIVVPIIVYLFWFWVHFAILIRSGTGDDFMSAAFQKTLHDSPLTLEAYGQSVTGLLGGTITEEPFHRDPLL